MAIRWPLLVRKTHKWLALFVGIQVVLWTVTGFYMVTVNVSSTAAASYSVSAAQNGSTSILTIRDSDTGAQSYSQSSTALAYLNAGDWVALSHTGTAAFQFGYGKTEILMALM